MKTLKQKIATGVLIGLCLTATADAGTGRTAVDPDGIDASEYVTVRDGHLWMRGRRVRFWGHIGHFPDPKLGQREKPRRDQELMVRRMKDLGFNMHRLWHQADREDYEIGDGSNSELRDYGIALLKENGIRIWFSPLNRLGIVRESDVGVVDDPDTAGPWREGIRRMYKDFWWSDRVGARLHRNLARMWDPRLKALALERMERIATHYNKHTGMRYADDPVMAVWELSNEEWWLRQMLMKGWWQDEDKLSDYFRKTLFEKWNRWLAEKYKTTQALRSRWGGLLAGESLEQGTVLFAPIGKPVDVDAQWRIMQVSTPDRARGRVTRHDLSDRRIADVISFCLETVIAQKRREEKALRTWGRSARLCPVVWNTGFGAEIHSQYLQQHGDAIAHVNYTHGLHHDPTHEHYPFRSGLTDVPRLRPSGVSRGEHGKAPAMPYFIYENQIANTTKYRAEYPMRMASLGAIQDWDIICWHSYGPGPDAALDRPNTRPIEVGRDLNLHFGNDEVQLSAMRAAAAIFRHGHLRPAPDPTHFVFGRRALLDRDSMITPKSYGWAGMAMRPTAYRYGCRVTVDPTLADRPEAPIFRGEDGQPDRARYERFLRDGYLIDGPTVRSEAYQTSPVRPTDQIVYDWRRGNLRFDAPAVAMFSGFYGRLDDPRAGVRFDNGVHLRDVRVVNPPDMPYPVREDARYITFALASTDGAPLGECERAVLSLVSTGFNTGYRLESARAADGRTPDVAEPGTLPVLVARVSAQIAGEAIDGMRYTLYDYEMNVIRRGVVRNGVLDISAADPVFFVELQRPARAAD